MTPEPTTRHWFACEQPERRPDALVRWHYDGEGCIGCRVKAIAQQRQFPDDPHVAWVAMMVAANNPAGSHP